ncbi:unnamed protein product [Paramecium octaurelia]|uniref:Uncharacterized protein n=1 Tax=Paramecium octaurelia TaxID=43137 RepID=A0A8S1S947_PAROT|nr:unnamed protein product [Paramecium octaurelia]
MICLSYHKCQSQRKLCAECIEEHGVDLKCMVSIIKFQDMMRKKFEDSKFNDSSELAKQRLNFKTLLTSTQNKFKVIWDGIEESIKQIYDFLEKEEKFYEFDQKQ